MPQLFALLRAINAGSRRCGRTMNTVPRSSPARSAVYEIGEGAAQMQQLNWADQINVAALILHSRTDKCRSPKLCEWQKRFRKRGRCAPSTFTIAMAIHCRRIATTAVTKSSIGSTGPRAVARGESLWNSCAGLLASQRVFAV